ncbi:hypothetical protein GCK32_015900, partial [Trichostrongylus colubriformis]
EAPSTALLQKRRFSTLKNHGNTWEKSEYSSAQGPLLDHNNVMSSRFAPVPVCTTPFHLKILDKIRNHATERPSQIALAYAEHPSKGMTYLELYRQAYAVASFLLQKGIGHLDVCCQVLPNCVEFAPSFLGTMLTGGVSLVANGSCTQEELKQAFVDSGCKAVITNSALLRDVFAATKYCPSVKVSYYYS